MDDPQINKSIHTRALHLPPTKFKRPTRQTQSKPNSPVQLAIEFSSGGAITIDLNQPVILGRHMENADDKTKVDISQTGDVDNGVSRFHAILHTIDGTIYVTDNNSLNGTYLNGAELYPMRNYKLTDGEALKLSSVKLQVKFII
jgi:pSer/pThr/pTyr-binding forkhead associated (FHA) protein